MNTDSNSQPNSDPNSNPNPPIPIKRGRPGNPMCPKCIEKGIEPPRLRKAPGKPCKECGYEYQYQITKAWQKRTRAKERRVRTYTQLHELFSKGLINQCDPLLDQLDRDRLLLNDEDREREVTIVPEEHYKTEAFLHKLREAERRQEEAPAMDDEKSHEGDENSTS